MQRSANDQQCHPGELQEKEEPVYSLDDYKKAFDSVPHSWILACLRMYKINPVLTTFTEASMRQWKTNVVLVHEVHESGVLETGPLSIKRGIFQGDSLSTLLFTMSLNPLSW